MAVRLQLSTRPLKEVRQSIGLPFPSLYLAIGKQDFLYEKNQDFLRFLQKEKVDFLYEEGDGIHDWNFWRRFIKRGIEAVLTD